MPVLTCAPGYQLATDPSQCCATCVPSLTLDCATGQSNYQQLRAQLTDKYAAGCSSDQDCVMVQVQNRCEPNCTYVPVWQSAAADLEPTLDYKAAMDCADCVDSPWPPCGIAPSAVCAAGQCEESSLN